MNEMEELKQEFLSEANELLVLMEEEVLNLEGDPHNKEAVNSIFRVAHTIKGGAASLDLERVAEFTHNLENLLDLVRDEKLAVDEELIDIVLKSLDILKEMVKQAAVNQNPPVGLEDQTLNQIKAKAGVGEKKAPEPKKAEAPVKEEKPKSPMLVASLDHIDDSIKQQLITDFQINDEKLAMIENGFKKGLSLYVVYVSLDPNYEMRSVSGIQTITAMKSIGEIVECNPPLSHIMVEEFVPQIQFLVLSNASHDKIYSKIYISDVVLDIEIENVGSLFGQESPQKDLTASNEPLKQGDLSGIGEESIKILEQFPKQEMTPEIKADIRMALEDGEKVYNIRMAINKDVPMRDVDSLLVLTTLEEIGDIICAVPSKRDLQKDIFYPVLDIIVKTLESAESLKDRCTIEETTLEISIAQFIMKEDEIAFDAEQNIEEKMMVESSSESSLKESSDMTETQVEETNITQEQDSHIIGNAPKFEKILDEQTTKELENKEEKEQKETAETLKEKFLSRLESVEESRVKGKDNTQAATQSVLRSFLKVDSARVDTLLNLVSELVITKAALLAIADPFVDSVTDYKLGMDETLGHLKGILEKSPEHYPTIKKVVAYLRSVEESWQSTDIFENTVSSISRSINELQAGIMKIRMVPIGNVFNKFSRVVRDVSKQLGKKLKLEIIGEDTELDKSVIEELSDPLMHMVRNSVDHGVELPDVRLKKGKPEEGTITLKAVHEGNVIRIEVADDGAGIDPEKIYKKAIEKELIHPSQTMTKEEILQLVLLPGFSTAEKVTDLSGRGVGMDVVKRNIEDLSGTITIQSEVGKGTSMIIKIPLTLSIIQALIIKIKGYYYSIPLNVISETIPLDRKQVQRFERSEVIYVNNEMVTIINVAHVFNIKETREERFKKYQESMMDGMDTELLDESIAILESSGLSGEANTTAKLFTTDHADYEFQDLGYDTQSVGEEFLVIVNIGSKKMGLVVDSIISEQDIVIKPLHKEYSLTRGVSGATILGDGSISLIIDVFQLTDLFLKMDSVVMLG